MCEPTTLAVIAVAGMAASTGMSIYSGMQQADAQSAIYKQQAKIAESNAQLLDVEGALEKQDREKNMRSALAKQQVMFGAQGTSVDPNVLAEISSEFASEQYSSDFNRKLERENLIYSASAANASASNTQLFAKQQAVATGIGAVGSMAGSASTSGLFGSTQPVGTSGYPGIQSGRAPNGALLTGPGGRNGGTV